MPDLKTFHNNKNIYSVDMMIAYVNTYGHPVIKVPIEDFESQLKEKVWGEVSPIDVIKNMQNNKYKEDTKKIYDANLTYPIILTGKHTVVDGYHRISKAYLDDKKFVSAYVFDSALMNKFIVNKDLDFVKVHQHTNVSQILELWTKRFCN